MNLLLEDYVKVAGLTRGFSEYLKHDIAKMNKYFVPCSYNQKFKVGNLEAELFDAGHIPGSASVYLSGSKRIMYTGDINTISTYLLGYKEIKYPKLDCLITESTYSEKEHPDRKIEENIFIEKVKEYENGLVLLPTFAVGRAQELLIMLNSYGIKKQIYLDGMAQKAADIILYHKNYIKDSDALKKVLKRVNFVRTRRQRDKIVRDGGIVVTTSGMLNGGPIVSYLKNSRDMKNTCLLITGYQAQGTPGEKLLKTHYFENGEYKFKVNMEIKKFDFSGHAGRSDLFNLIKRISPKKVICVHGDNTPKFAKEIKEKLNIEALAPKMGESAEI
jgi:putative mRNA 3-end processing factor